MLTPIISLNHHLTFSPFYTTVHANSIIDKLDAFNMPNTFVEATNSLDISRDRHTNSIPKVIINTEFEIFINNSSFILNLTPKLTQQESTRQAMEILVDQPSHDNMVIHHSTKIISDYDHDIWKYQFLELFPYGHNGPDEQHPTKLGLEVYMANTLQFSSR
jgi:hypothetical protein